MSEASQANVSVPPRDWVGPEPMPAAAARSPFGGWSATLLVAMLLIMVGGGLWLHTEIAGILRVRDAAPQLDQLGRWQWLATWFTLISGLALLGFAVLGYRRLQDRFAKNLAARDHEWRDIMKDLRTRFEEKRRIEIGLREQQHDLQQRLNSLTRAHDEVQAELSRIQLAEEVFTQQRRELLRSKDVLELHVQARAQQLQKLQRTYELILNSAGEGICGLDITGKITFVNPAAAKMMGCAVSEMTGQAAAQMLPDFVHPPAGPDGVNEALPVEVSATRRDGTRFEAEFVRTPIREDGRRVGEVLLFKDITERKRAAETLAQKAAELARSNAELEQFAFVASHDLQEPLRKIQAFGDRLKAKCTTVNLEEGRDYLDRMQNAAARMQTLIYDLLTFSRVISRTEPFVPVDLQTVAREVVGDLEVRIEKTGAQVEVGELPTIEADALQMRQLLQNLLGNALKFHAPGKTPVVRVTGRLLAAEAIPAHVPAGLAKHHPASGAPYCELTVTDNGIGFDEKYLDRIFAVFQRLHGRQEYEGTGIGLAVCRRIVDRHAGIITARSRPGEGATFVVLLPAKQSQSSLAKGDA
jgi:PAS domain S-box-containing protein